jgi:hypothetical protein
MLFYSIADSDDSGVFSYFRFAKDAQSTPKEALFYKRRGIILLSSGKDPPATYRHL